jgi:hypothetical protein
MSPLPQDCQRFRALWLERIAVGRAPGDDHVAQCGSCRTWAQAAALQVRAFEDLVPIAAPDELDQRVARTFGDSDEAVHERHERVADSVAGLDRLTAPDELAERLFPLAAQADTTDDPELPDAVRALGVLERLHAPPVLERLVAEELEDPKRHGADRLVGSLPRRLAPAALDRRVDGGLRQRMRPRWMAVASLAAAALLAWVGLDRVIGREAPDSSYSFRVVRADAGSVMGPHSRSLGGALTGAIIPANPVLGAQPIPPSDPGEGR